MKKILCMMAMVLLVAATASAVPVKLGTASGGLMIYYNNLDVSGADGTPDTIVSGYDENSDNQAYIKFQVGYGSTGSPTDGMAFQFDDTVLGYDPGSGLPITWQNIYSGLPAGQTQFGLDLQATSPTYDPSGGVGIPSMVFADNVDNNVTNAALTNVIPDQGQVAWAVNDYKGGSGSGPGNGGSEINSLFRGTGFTMNLDGAPVYDEAAQTYTLSIFGELITDGKMHWYDPDEPGQNGDGTTDLADWGMSESFYYEGTLVYSMLYGTMNWGTEDNTYAG